MMDLAPADVSVPSASDVCDPFVLPPTKSPEPAPQLLGREVALDRGEFLCREGELKTALHRLESGILCVTVRRASGPPRVVEMIFPGCFVGLGFLERHIHTVMAVVPSRLTEFPLSAAAEICSASVEARDRQALQTEREFAARRRELVPDTDERPVLRVAAFLSAMYHMNRQEGRNPAFIAEFLKTGDVAAFLNLNVDALATALAELNERGLIERAQSGGLTIVDPDALDRLTSSE